MLKRLLVLALALALVAGVACGGDDGDDDETGTPRVPTAVPTQTPPPQSSTGTIDVTTEAVSAGGTVEVTGANWPGTGAVALYLLTAEQVDDSALAVANGEAPKLGDATPDAGGNISFEFTLESSYTTESGATVEVAAGGQFAVFALRDIGGSISDTFTVQ